MSELSDIQDRIVLEIGDLPSMILADHVAGYWSQYADKSVIHPRLQELYTKRALIDIKLGAISNQVTFSTDGSLSLQLSKRTDYMTARRDETQKEIVRLETIARANRPSVIGTLTVSELEPPPNGLPDATDPTFTGSPYFDNPGTGGNPF